MGRSARARSRSGGGIRSAAARASSVSESEPFGPLGVGLFGLVLEALFRLLERRGHAEDGTPALDRHHAPSREAGAVADAVHVVDDGSTRVAGTQEVTVKRVHRAAVGDGLLRGGQRLSQHLPAEDVAPAEILALAAKQSSARCAPERASSTSSAEDVRHSAAKEATQRAAGTAIVDREAGLVRVEAHLRALARVVVRPEEAHLGVGALAEGHALVAGVLPIASEP